MSVSERVGVHGKGGLAKSTECSCCSGKALTVLGIVILGLVAIAIIVTVFVCIHKTDCRHVLVQAGWLKLDIERDTPRKKLPPRGNARGS